MAVRQTRRSSSRHSPQVGPVDSERADHLDFVQHGVRLTGHERDGPGVHAGWVFELMESKALDLRGGGGGGGGRRGQEKLIDKYKDIDR